MKNNIAKSDFLTTLSVLFCLLMSAMTSAQIASDDHGLFDASNTLATTLHDDETPKARLEIGLNVSRFINQYLGLSDDTFAENLPYLATVHIPISGRHYIRAGLGLRLENRSTNDDSNGGNLTAEQDLLDLDARLGFEKRIVLSRKWYAFTGADLVLEMRNSKIRTISDFGGEVVIEDDVLSYGGGPFFGVGFRFNDRLALWTEANLYFTIFDQTNVTEDVNGGFRQSRETSGNDLDLTAPLSLVFALRL